MHSSLLFKSAKSTLLNINCSESKLQRILVPWTGPFPISCSVVPQIRVRSVVKMESGGEYVCASHFPPAEAVSRRAHAAYAPSRNPPTLAVAAKLRNGVQLLECRCERVRQAPHGPRRELLMLGIEE